MPWICAMLWQKEESKNNEVDIWAIIRCCFDRICWRTFNGYYAEIRWMNIGNNAVDFCDALTNCQKPVWMRWERCFDGYGWKDSICSCVYIEWVVLKANVSWPPSTDSCAMLRALLLRLIWLRHDLDFIQFLTVPFRESMASILCQLWAYIDDLRFYLIPE